MNDESRPPREASRIGRTRTPAVQKARRPRRSDAEHQSLAALLNLIRSRGPLTRQELEQRSGLGRAVVANRLAALARLGLADEAELGQPSGGRAPRLVRFRGNAGLILLAALDPGKISVGAADVGGQLLIEHHEAADADRASPAAAARLATLFDWILDQHRDGRPIWGIAIAMPGPVEVASGGRVGAPSVLRNPVAGDLMRRYAAPVAVRDSVHMRTLGELRAAGDHGDGSLVFVHLGREIAAGLVSAGELVRGAQGVAGMIGHVPVEAAGGIVCRCGNSGCLEVAAGAAAIVGEATRAAREERSRALADVLATSGEISVADVGLAAQRGDPFSAELLSRCGRQIGSVLAAVANAFNPSLVVLGGEVAETGDILLAAIREAIYRSAHPLVTRDLRIVRSRMGDSAGLLGSALTLIDDFFAGEFLSGWIAAGTPLGHPEVSALLAAGKESAAAEAPRPPAPQNTGGRVR